MSAPEGTDPGGLSPEAARHARLSAVLGEAMELPGEERRSFVQAACGEDEELAVEVLSLLSLDALPPARVAVPGTWQDAPGLALEPESPVSPETVGSGIPGYRVLRVIGEGGMGTVYEAEQDRPRRRVALKVIRSLHGGSESLARFRREAEALARLQHPGICQVLEVGQDSAGTPYIAMELIAGRSVVAHAREHQLTRHERLALLCRICDAIGHAHERGIVHRDLKPENLLVTEEGQPKVVDFGIARMTGPESGATLLTSTGALLGTLGYMSPEQAAGDTEIDGRADVYALGIIGFELLTDRSPVTLDGLSLPQALHVMQRAEHSLALRGEPSLRGDLDTILGKALERDPSRRYATAHELASDLRRFLQHEPIVARPPSLSYRLAKFTRRHRVLVVAGTLVFASLSVGAMVALNQARVADQRADLAERQSYRASLGATVAALDTRLVPRAAAQLRGAPPALRGWEFDHLQARISEQWGQVVHEGRVDRAQFSADGSVLFALEVRPGESRLLQFQVPGFQLTATHPLDARPAAIPPEALDLALEGLLLDGSFGGARDVVAAGDQRLLARVRIPEGTADSQQLHASGSSLLAVYRAPNRPDETQVCDLRTGATLESTFRGGLAEDLSPDGRRFVSASGGSATVFDIRSGEAVWTLPPSSDGLSSVAFSADGRLLYTAGLAIDPVLRKWEIGANRPLAERPIARASAGERWAPAAGGGALAWTASHAVIHVTDSGLKTELGSGAAERGGFACLALDSAGRHLVAAANADTLRHWDLRGPRADVRLRGHESYVYAVDFSPDGRFLASASWDDTVRVWDVATQELTRLIEEACGGTCHEIAWSFDGSRLFAAGRLGLVVIDPATGHREESLLGAGRRYILKTNPARALTGWLLDERLRVLENQPLSVLGEWSGVSSFGWSPDGETLALSSRDGTLTLRDSSSLRTLWSVADAEWGSGRWLSFSGNGESLWLVSGAGLSEWDARSGGLLRRVPSVKAPFSAARSPDGRGFVTGTTDGTLVFWDLASGDDVVTLDAHSSYVKDLAFSPDGLHLASASGDGTVGLWSIEPAARSPSAGPREGH